MLGGYPHPLLVGGTRVLRVTGTLGRGRGLWHRRRRGDRAHLAPGAALAVEQEHLLEARQMQALSFIVHIPLVCFGLALPSLVLFMEWLHLRTGGPVTASSHGAGRRSWSPYSPQGR
jgi:hypothetical protein